MTKIYQKRFKNSCPIDHSTTHYTTQLEIQIETCRSILLLTTLLIERYCKRFSPLDVYFFSKTRQQRQNHKEDTRHQNSMTTTCGLGGKSKLPKAGLEHREILPPSSCEDRD